MRYFLKLAYNGAPFHGWQRQPNAPSVQETLEDSLSKILRDEVQLTGAGRTDTGVNAREMYAHFDSKEEIEDKGRFLLSLNSLIGKDIAVYEIIPVKDEAHARFDALRRSYKYFISYRKNPFLRHLSWHIPSFLDIERMNQAADLLLENNDFTSFAKLHSDVKTNICHVTYARWLNVKDDIESRDFMGDLDNGIVFTITADRFLRNMVRAIVGTLVDVGRGKLSVSDFQNIIDRKNRCAAGSSVPPYPLFLWSISYPFINKLKHN